MALLPFRFLTVRGAEDIFLTIDIAHVIVYFLYPVSRKKIFQLALPPGFPIHNKKAAATKIVDMFQNQVKLNGSDARIKMYGDIPYATPWWSWLFR